MVRRLTPTCWATLLAKLPSWSWSNAWARLSSQAFELLRTISRKRLQAPDASLNRAMSLDLLAPQGYPMPVLG
jgi:hypothetical protein